MTPHGMPLYEQLKATGRLPSPKGVALAILHLSQKEEASLAELARIVKTDPALAGRVIRAANSVRANPGRPVVSLQEALVVLGIPAVRNLALGLSLLSQYRKGECSEFDYPRFWSASLACGIALQELARQVRAVVQPEEAFSLGLLARIGELALATLHGEEYARLLRAAARSGPRELERLERETFALTHSELGAAMLADWGLPEIFVAVVRRQEEEAAVGEGGEGREARLARLLATARAIAALCLSEETERPQRHARVCELGAALSLEGDVLGKLCDDVVAEWRDWAGLLDVVSQPLPAFAAMAARAVPAAPPSTAPPPLRLLAVDVAADAARTLAEVAAAGGFLVERSSAESALPALLVGEPHLLCIGGAQAARLVRALRESRAGRGTYVIVLTATSDEGAVAAALEAGADDVLPIPLGARLLAARLAAGRRLIGLQQELEREREALRRQAAELAASNRRLQELALTDVLTGMPNRRYALNRLAQEWAAATRRDRSLAVMVIDLDELKQVNDLYGHDIGDAYLAQTAATMRAALRAQDVLCRTGGDEFLVICPDTDLEAALSCAERVRREVAARPVAAGQLRLRGTVSIGVAQRDDDIADAEALVRQADQGACLAKQRGRDRVVCLQTAGGRRTANFRD